VHAVFLAKVLLANELNLDTRRLGDGCRIRANRIPQRRREAGVIEDADVMGIQVVRHAFGVTQLAQAAGDHNPVVATQNTVQTLSVFLGQQLCHHDITSP